MDIADRPLSYKQITPSSLLHAAGPVDKISIYMMMTASAADPNIPRQKQGYDARPEITAGIACNKI